MNSRIFGLHGALAALALVAACKKDPTAADVGTPNSLTFELDARTLAVADSFHSFAILRDRLGNPLDEPVAVTSCNTGVATVIPTSDAPQVRTAFFVKAVAFSATPVCIAASAAGFTDTMFVTAVPFALIVSGGPANDTITSGGTGTYTFVYRDAKNLTLGGVPNPTFSTGDTTIAKAGATVGQVQGRAPGLTTVRASGPGGVSGFKNVTVVAAAFTGTNNGPVLPGAKITIIRDPATAFDVNTATSIGTIATADKFYPDSFRVRVGDLAAAGSASFTVTGVGANDVAYKGSYTVNAPPAFTGTFNPASAQAGINIAVIRNPADPAFTGASFFRGTSVGGLAAVTPVSGSITADSFKLSVSDLAAGGTYYVQVTRLGATNLAWRGSYTLPVGTWGGTMAPSSGRPTDLVVLKKGGGDPQFDADTRVFLGGVRAFIDQFSTDTAVIVVPPVEFTGETGMRISRMGAAQQAVDDAVGLNSTSSSPLDPFDHANDFYLGATPLTVNGNHYITLSGTCDSGVPTKGADDCDDLYQIHNTTGSPISVTVTLSWFTDADIDILWCNADCSGFVGNFNGATSANPETSTVSIPAGATWNLWLNLFDHGTPNATLARVNVTGLP